MAGLVGLSSQPLAGSRETNSAGVMVGDSTMGGAKTEKVGCTGSITSSLKRGRLAIYPNLKLVGVSTLGGASTETVCDFAFSYPKLGYYA
jgi:hypothetical protein